MTELLYLKDSYQKEFEAKVVKIENNLVYLDKTLFYPTGGGQANDTGTLGGLHVIDVRKTADGVAHKIECEHDFTVGDTVKGKIDWTRRYELMKLHTASHVLCAEIHKKANALVSGHKLTPQKSSIDFTLENMDKELMRKAVNDCNEKMQKGAAVTLSWMKREDALLDPELVKLANVLPPAVDELRIVTIAGLDRQADGGTHVHNTNEIGKIEIIKFENKGKGRKRLYIQITQA